MSFVMISFGRRPENFDKRRELVISTSLLELHPETFLHDATEYDGYLASVYWDFDDDQLNLVHIRPVRVIDQKMFVDNWGI